MSEFQQDTLERAQSKLFIEKAKGLEEGQIEAILSTDNLDRHGERVSITGIVIPKDQVIKMYYNHQTYGDSLPIGKWSRIWKQNGVLKGIGNFDLEDDFAAKVYRKVKNGFIDSISIGFYPQEFDGETSTWTKSTLVEASVVAEPANVAAKITSKELGFNQEEFERALKVKLKEVKSDLEPDSSEPPEEPELPDNEDGVVDTEIKTALEELKSRIGAVEESLESADRPAIKQLIKMRGEAKKVDQAAEELNKVLRIKLKETN